jgi:hypothetical protein
VFGFIFSVAIITVVGHLLWLMFAALFRTLRGSPISESNPSQPTSAPLQLSQERRQRVTLAELEKLRESGYLSKEAYDEVLAAYSKDELARDLLNVEAVPEPPPLPIMRTPEAGQVSPPLPRVSLEVEQVAEEQGREVVHPWSPSSYASEDVEASIPKVEEKGSPVPPPLPRQTVISRTTPKASFADMLSSFMESKHIKWGELVGGMLIVLCSAALVVSFWSTIAAIPILKFGLFTGATAAIFGAALFMHYRWRMPSTSRGVLLTASLLVPLNFLAIAAFSTGTLPAVLTWGGKAGAALLFGMLLFLGARILTPKIPWAIPLGVMFSSLPMMIIGSEENISPHWVIVPILAFTLATLGAWWILRAVRKGEESFLNMGGIVLFSTLVTLGLIAFRSSDVGDLLRYVAPYLALLAPTFLAGGIWMWKKPEQGEGFKLTGAGLGIFGTLVLGLCGGAAFPLVWSMAMVSLIAFVTLFVVGWRLQLSLVQLPAAAALSILLALLLHVMFGGLSWTLSNAQTLVKASYAAPTMFVYAGVASVLFGLGLTLKSNGYWYKRASLAVACYHVLLLTVHGLGSNPDHGALLFYACYALAAFAIAFKWKLSVAVWSGWVLVLACLVQGVAFRWEVASPWSLVFMALSALSLAVYMSVRWAGDKWDVFQSSSGLVSLWSSIIAAVLLVFLVHTPGLCWPRGLGLTAIWLVSAFAYRSIPLFAFFQVALAGSLLVAATDWWNTRPWGVDLGQVYCHPYAWQTYACILALLASGFLTLRLSLRTTRPEFSLKEQLRMFLWDVPFPIDRLLAGVSLLGSLGIIFGAVLVSLTRSGKGGLMEWTDLWLGWGSLAGLLLSTLYLLLALRDSWEIRRIALLFFAGLGVLVWSVNALSLPGFLAENLRWAVAIYGLSVSALVWGRDRLVGFLGDAPSREFAVRARDAGGLVEGLVYLSAAIFVLPLGFDTRYLLGGPMGQGWLFAGPLTLVASIVFGYAIREGCAWRGLAAGILSHLAVSLAVIAELDFWKIEDLIYFVQLHLLTFGLFGLLWRAAESRLGGSELRYFYSLAGFVLSSAIAMIGAYCIFALPDRLPGWISQLTWPIGWAATTLCWASFLQASSFAGRLRTSVLAGGSLVVVALLACLWPASAWVSFHALLAGLLGIQLLLLHPLAGSLGEARTRWGVGIWGAVILFAIRGYADDPVGHLWLTTAGLVSTGILAWLTWAEGSRRLSYLVGLGSVIIAELLVMGGKWGGIPFDLVGSATLGLAAAGAFALWLERQRLVTDKAWGWPDFSSCALLLNLASLGILSLFNFGAELGGQSAADPTWLVWSGLAASLILSLVRCWDPALGYRGLPVYTTGFVGLLLGLGSTNWLRADLVLASILAFGIYQLFTAAIYRWRDSIVSVVGFSSHQGPMPLYFAASQWSLTCLLTLTAAGLVLLPTELVLTSRILAGLSILLPLGSLALLARDSDDTRIRRVALGLGSFSMIVTLWALIAPGSQGDTPLNRLAVVMGVLVPSTVVFLSLSHRLRGAWSVAAGVLAKWGEWSWVPVLAAIIGLEGWQRLFTGAAGIDLWAAWVVLAAIAGVSTMLIRFALDPTRDPLKASERSRMPYVYAAEVALFLGFVHLWLTMPWLFGGILLHYWPFIVMGLAFLGAGLSEVLRRKETLVLAEPLEKSAGFLPLIPLLGFWAVDSALPYSGLLFTVSLFYGVLAIMRKSFALCLAAALAGNVGLWFVWGRMEGFGFLQHPQLWLIPLALSGLGASYLNRKNMSESHLATVRYISLLMIYVSSSADLFIHGVGNSLWLPLILGGLSVAGVLVGIALRVRSFLFLGSAFLLLDLLAIIWHASENLGWTWIWYVAGIGLGVAIISIFAVFERQREAILKVIENLRKWD